MTISATSSAISDVVLPSIGILVALLVGIAAAWATYVVGFPKRKLFYELRLRAPLLTPVQSKAKDLELRYLDTVLTQPYIAEIQIVSRGRTEIPTNAFDSNEPIRLDVGADIVSLLQVTSEPDFLIPPKVNIDGTKVNIGPNLIGRRQKIGLTLLTKGSRPELSWQSSLQGVKIQRRAARPYPGFIFWYGIVAGLLLIAIASAIAGVASGTKWMAVPDWATPVQAAQVSFQTIAFAAGTAAILFTLVAHLFRKYRKD